VILVHNVYSGGFHSPLVVAQLDKRPFVTDVLRSRLTHSHVHSIYDIKTFKINTELPDNWDV